jgi:ABC-type lipoprotein release transport system permease subunit
MTLLGISVVVAIFVFMVSMVSGLHSTLADMGEPSNVIVLGRTSMVEAFSFISRESFGVIKQFPEVARDSQGRSLASAEALPVWAVTDSAGKDLQVPMRGISDMALQLHSDVHLVRGRLPRPGQGEVIVGSQLAGNVPGLSEGKTFRWGRRQWTTVGVFEAHGCAFESEVWGDLEGVLDDDHRTEFSSITLRLKDDASYESLRAHLESDPRLAVRVQHEMDYYRAQGGSTKPLEAASLVVAMMMAVAAVFGATNTMQASLAGRMRELAMLRALGFTRSAIFLAIVAETLLLALPAGVLGCLMALAVEGQRMNAMNVTTFSSVTVGFHVTPGVAAAGLVFAFVLGVSAGFWPAYSASRGSIVAELRK